MKTCVVYDSVHGNTEKIAKVIGDVFAGGTKVLRVGELSPTEIRTLDLLIVGAPTHGGRASESARAWLDRIPEDALQGIRVAAFDTRLTTKLVQIFGYAAPRIAASLEAKGGTLIGSPGAFFVTGGKGPLKEGELERAAAWAKEIAESAK